MPETGWILSGGEGICRSGQSERFFPAVRKEEVRYGIFRKSQVRYGRKFGKFRFRHKAPGSPFPFRKGLDFTAQIMVRRARSSSDRKIPVEVYEAKAPAAVS